MLDDLFTLEGFDGYRTIIENAKPAAKIPVSVVGTACQVCRDSSIQSGAAGCDGSTHRALRAHKPKRRDRRPRAGQLELALR